MSRKMKEHVEFLWLFQRNSGRHLPETRFFSERTVEQVLMCSCVRFHAIEVVGSFRKRAVVVERMFEQWLMFLRRGLPVECPSAF